MSGVMLINHFFACGWYGVGSLQGGDLSGSWIAELEESDASMLTRYLESYQWSLAQFTPSSTDHLPVNNEERFFALLVLFVGLVVYSALLGNATAIINHARSSAFEQMMQSAMMRNFLLDHGVSADLQHSITLFLKDSKASKKQTSESDVVLIKQLPRHLREELHYEVYSPVITAHVLFALTNVSERQAGLHICHSATTQKSLVKGAEPFHYGMKGTSMIFPITGSLDYFVGPENGHLFVSSSVSITPGQWMTEAPLWIQWEHCGLLSAHDNCTTVDLDSYRFRKCIAQRSLAIATFRTYAALFICELSQSVADGYDIDDIWGTPASAPCKLHRSASELEELLKAAASSAT